MLADLATLERTSPGASFLIVTGLWPSPDRPAYGIFVQRQVESLVELGIECDVLFIHGYRSKFAYVVAGARLLRWNLGRRRAYRLIHAHGGETSIPARCFVRAPLLVSYLGSDLLGARNSNGDLSLRQRTKAFVLRQFARTSRATITKSAEMEATLPGGARKRNVVLPNGVDRTVFKPLATEAAREVMNWGSEERIALFAADPAIGNKRFELARQACEAATIRTGEPIRLHVAAGLDPSMMPVLMNAADCLLHTSITEGSPNVVKEALACDLPVIATPSGDIAELIANVEGCHACDATVQELSGALVACLARGTRSNGRDQTEWLSSEKIAQRLADVYRRLARVAE